MNGHSQQQEFEISYSRAAKFEISRLCRRITWLVTGMSPCGLPLRVATPFRFDRQKASHLIVDLSPHRRRFVFSKSLQTLLGDGTSFASQSGPSATQGGVKRGSTHEPDEVRTAPGGFEISEFGTSKEVSEFRVGETHRPSMLFRQFRLMLDKDLLSFLKFR